MFPILIEIGPFTLHTYGFFIALGFLGGMALAAWQAALRGRNPAMVQDMGFYAIIGAILGSRALFVLMNPSYFWNHPLEIMMFWKGGLVFLGGALLAVAMLVYYVRSRGESVLTWADIGVPGLALGQAIGRLGCFSAGCCYGKQCDLPWAVTFTDPNSLAPLNVPLHPTQLYASVSGLINCVILVLLARRLHTPGRVAGAYILLYAPSRIFIETLRADFRGDLGPFSTTQLIAGLLMFLGLWLVLRKAPGQTTQGSRP